MKIKILQVFFIAAFLFAVVKVGASASTLAESNADASGLIEEFNRAVYDECGIDTEKIITEGGIGLDAFFGEAASVIQGYTGQLLPFFLTVLGFAVLIEVSSAASFSSVLTKTKTQSAILVLFSTVAFPQLETVFTAVAESLESVISFFGVAMPVMTAITAASGSVNSAAIQAMNMNILLGSVGSVAVSLLIPLSRCMLTLALVSSLGDNGVYRIASSIKTLFTFGLGMVSAVSSAIIALQSIIAGARDSAALRAARYAVGGLIPVVGSSVSGALSTLAGGLAYAKSTVGASAIMVILLLALTPLLLMLLFRLSFSVALFLLEFCGNVGGVRCFSAFKTAIDSVISVYVMSIIVCIVQFVVFMKGGASI